MIFSKISRRIFTVSSVLVVLMSTQVNAQSNLNIRTGAHADYSRLVFDWPETASYEVKKQGGTLSIQFDKAASVNIDALDTASLKNIGQVSLTSQAGEPLSLTVGIKEQSDYRHFNIGNRVVLDVYNAAGEVAALPAKRAKAEPVTAEPIKQETVETPPELQAESSIQIDQAQPIKPRSDQLLGGLRPHVISLTATNEVGLSVFERSGFLWLVFDDPELKFPPVLSGPNRDSFPAFDEVKFQGGVAYRMPRPEGYNVYGEGGGLLWRVTLTPKPRDDEATKPELSDDGIQTVSGGIINWPMRGVERVVIVPDPLLGDEITVVTVDSAKDFTGEPRRFVELETLNSHVGLALVQKVDDLEVTPTPDGVVVSRPQGLVLSPERDTAPVILKDDIQKEEEAFRQQEKTSTMARIFNFDRWEMGGVSALEDNRRIIMMGIGRKDGSAKVEDLITLAKLNIANDRGQEALGLLRVAENELPGIEENAEFIALKGAAGTLAGKFDEAIEDLSSETIQQYDEINYWKAVALGGLEDWQQADKVMPTDLDFLREYPKHVKQPVALKLSEVALRAGKTNLAQEFLTLLEPDFPAMSLSRQSAWKYLNGELERQTNKIEQAETNWESLVRGRDDYYRAKAGLSLTRLQLEQKKITPAKAIDRLEGLRYAWRGDELETLINMRLGKVYVDNNDYLKGLSVLRNAVSLSPDSIIAQEVTDYMTSTFRSLFIEGKLDNVSPLDAVSIYDEFKELTPIGKEGDIFVQRLAERLVDVDLLGRASALLENQLTRRLEGDEATKVGIRLAAIRLLDNKPEGALKALKAAEKAAPQNSNYSREVSLLKARALSQVNRVDDALALLSKLTPDQASSRLRADIAWNAGRWDVAATAFGRLVEDETISQTRPLNDYQANLLLNRSIALNLAGNRVALANMRERYEDLMMQSEKSKLFDLVTRPRQLGLLGNRESITSLISEVDLFGGFLESYRKIN